MSNDLRKKSTFQRLIGDTVPLAFLVRLHLTDRFEKVLREYSAVILILTVLVAFWSLAIDSIHGTVAHNKLATFFFVAFSEDGVTHLRSWHVTRAVSALSTLFLYFYAGKLELMRASRIPVESRRARLVFHGVQLLRLAASTWTLGCGGLLSISWGLEHLNVVIDLTPKLFP